MHNHGSSLCQRRHSFEADTLESAFHTGSLCQSMAVAHVGAAVLARIHHVGHNNLLMIPCRCQQLFDFTVHAVIACRPYDILLL